MSRSNQQRVWVIAAAGLLLLAAWFSLSTSRAVLVGSDAHSMGYVPNEAGVRAFLSELAEPMFAQAGAECIEQAKGKDAYLYRYANAAHQDRYGAPFSPLNQGQHGSCVSFGWAAGSYFGQAIDWATGKRLQSPLLVATEPIYAGSRTAARLPPVKFAGYSDGSYGAAAARWVAGLKTGQGGIVFREKYGDIDLTTYSIPRSKEWGAYGCPAPIAKAGMRHTARAVALCENWDSLVAALESGYVVPVCSNVGFASGDRDADGFCARRSSWSHCMLICSVKYAANNGPKSAEPMQNPRDGVLVLNSWGNYLRGGKHPTDQPDGSFWIVREDAEAILKQSDSFVIGGVNGFEYRDLHHGKWMGQPPQPKQLPAGVTSIAF